MLQLCVTEIIIELNGTYFASFIGFNFVFCIAHDHLLVTENVIDLI